MQTFTETLILPHFDPECHIWIETNAFTYAIGSVFSQMTSETDQWHLVGYYSQKIIQAEMRYETYDAK